MKKNNFTRKIIAAVFLTIVIFNVFWLSYREFRFNPFVENIPKQHGTYITSTEGYTYSVSKPRYLKFNGNLALINNESDLTLIVWPLFPKGYRYAVILEHSTVEIDYEANLVNLNDKSNNNINSEINKNKESIKDLLSVANNMWNLF